MREKNWFSIATFLAGIIIAGAIGVLRGDFLGGKAAEAVEMRVVERADRDMAEVRADLTYLRSRLDELIALQK